MQSGHHRKILFDFHGDSVHNYAGFIALRAYYIKKIRYIQLPPAGTMHKILEKALPFFPAALGTAYKNADFFNREFFIQFYAGKVLEGLVHHS